MSTKILAIDDSRTIRNLLRVSLEGAGFEFHAACDGVEGVEMFPDVEPDVVITDINMPNINGLELLSFIRNNPQHVDTPVLVVTTEGAARDREKGLALGATDYLVKPFENEVLIETVRRLLQEKE